MGRERGLLKVGRESRVELDVVTTIKVRELPSFRPLRHPVGHQIWNLESDPSSDMGVRLGFRENEVSLAVIDDEFWRRVSSTVVGEAELFSDRLGADFDGEESSTSELDVLITRMAGFPDGFLEESERKMRKSQPKQFMNSRKGNDRAHIVTENQVLVDQIARLETIRVTGEVDEEVVEEELTERNESEESGISFFLSLRYNNAKEGARTELRE